MNILNYGMCGLIIGAGLFFLYLMTENKKIPDPKIRERRGYFSWGA